MTDPVTHPMPDHDSDSPSYVAPSAVRPDVGRTPTGGAAPAAHPELSASLPDAVAARIADAEVNGEHTAFPYPNHPGAPMDHAPAGHWSSTKLSTGEDA